MSTHKDLGEDSLVELKSAEGSMQVPTVETVNVKHTDVTTFAKSNPASVPDVFSRDVLLTQVSIASTDTPFVNLLGDFDLWYLYFNDPLIEKYLSPFQFVSCDLVVTVKIVVPGSCYGTYNVQCLCEGGPVPASGYEVDSAAVDSYPNSTQDVHGFLNIDLKNDLLFELPWVNYVDSVTVNPLTQPLCWRMLIWALSPIQNTLSNSVANGTIQVYARMGEKKHFESLRFQGKKDKQDPHPTKKKGKKASQMMGDMAKGVAIAGGMFPEIAAFAEPVAAGLAAVSTIADYFGFTREAVPTMPSSVRKTMFSSLANYDGQDSSEIVSLSVSNCVSIDPTIGGGDSQDVMSNASLFERWTILNIASITPDSAGVILTLPVTPFCINPVLGVSYFTTAGFVGLPFGNWRGTMEYMIYIPSSSNLQGALQVLWDPQEAAVTGYSSDPTHKLANVIIDLHGTSKTLIKVGYSREAPVLHSSVMVGDSFSGNKECNGQLVFYMNAPLTAPRVTGYSLQIIVMARACEDMEFGNPRGLFNSPTGVKNLQNVRFQGLDEEEDQAVTLVLPSTYPVEECLFGEKMRSVRALMQHFGWVFNPTFPLNTPVWSISFPHFFPPPYNNGSAIIPWLGGNGLGAIANPPFTYASYYQMLFVGIRGSTRTKIMVDTVSASQAFACALAPKQVNFEGVWSSHGMQYPPEVISVMSVSNEIGAEFAFPAKAAFKYYLARWVPSVSTLEELSRYDVIGFDINPGLSPVGNMQYAVGPDFTAIRFRRVPGVILG